MHGGIQGDIIYMCDEFGVHGKLYVEVIRTSCFMAKHENGPHVTDYTCSGPNNNPYSFNRSMQLSLLGP